MSRRRRRLAARARRLRPAQGRHVLRAGAQDRAPAEATPANLRASSGCDQLALPGHPGVALMFVDDELTRIDLFRPARAPRAASHRATA
jgi:hypothetical protein